MPVVSAAGRPYTPCVIFPGKSAHFRVVNGHNENLQSNLMKCLVYHCDPPGADSAIVYDWAKVFVAETEHLRATNKRLLFLLDGMPLTYSLTPSICFERKKNALELPSHTSHELQPLDVTVFGPFKSYLQRKLRRAAQVKMFFLTHLILPPSFITRMLFHLFIRQ